RYLGAGAAVLLRQPAVKDPRSRHKRPPPRCAVESRSGAVTDSPVSRSRSSNRTCGSPASGFRTRVLLSFRPRQVGMKVCQPDYPELLIKILVGKMILDPSSYLVFSSQPLAQPMSNVAIHALIGFAYRTKPKIIGPSL